MKGKNILEILLSEGVFRGVFGATQYLLSMILMIFCRLWNFTHIYFILGIIIVSYSIVFRDMAK